MRTPGRTSLKTHEKKSMRTPRGISELFSGEFQKEFLWKSRMYFKKNPEKMSYNYPYLLRKTIQNHAEGGRCDSRLIHEHPVMDISLFPFGVLCACRTMKNGYWLRKLTS